MIWDWCIQHWKTWSCSTWSMIGLLFSHLKLRGNLATLRYFWDIPPGHTGFSISWRRVFATRQISSEIFGLQGLLSQKLLEKQNLTLKTHRSPSNIKTFQVGWLLLVCQKHPRDFVAYDPLPISKSGVPPKDRWNHHTSVLSGEMKPQPFAGHTLLCSVSECIRTYYCRISSINYECYECYATLTSWSLWKWTVKKWKKGKRGWKGSSSDGLDTWTSSTLASRLCSTFLWQRICKRTFGTGQMIQQATFPDLLLTYSSNHVQTQI